MERVPSTDRAPLDPVWLITGCSTGIGRAIATAALEAGDRVVLTARDPSSVEDLVGRFGDRALACLLDVTRVETIGEAFEAAVARFGRVDILVNNAGYGYVSSVEEGVDSEVRKMFDTNFFGAIDTIKAVLPAMRARRSGFIINISSMTGLVSNPGNIYYSASKFALESLTEGLAKELSPFGIRVSAVEPGLFKTDWSSRSMKESPATIEDYVSTVGLRREQIRTAGASPAGDPQKVGEALVMLSRLETPPRQLLLGRDVLAATRAKLEEVAASLAEWEATTLDVVSAKDQGSENGRDE